MSDCDTPQVAKSTQSLGGRSTAWSRILLPAIQKTDGFLESWDPGPCTMLGGFIGPVMRLGLGITSQYPAIPGVLTSSDQDMVCISQHDNPNYGIKTHLSASQY